MPSLLLKIDQSRVKLKTVTTNVYFNFLNCFRDFPRLRDFKNDVSTSFTGLFQAVINPIQTGGGGGGEVERGIVPALNLNAYNVFKIQPNAAKLYVVL